MTKYFNKYSAIYNFFDHFIMKLVYKWLSSRKRAEYFCILSEMANGRLLFWTLHTYSNATNIVFKKLGLWLSKQVFQHSTGVTAII